MDFLDNLEIENETITFSNLKKIDLAEFFKSLDLLDFELLTPEMKKTFVPTVLGNDIFKINKIKKYPELFGDTYDVFTYEPSMYEESVKYKKKPICLSYCLFSLTKEDLSFPIESLLNLYKTCQIVEQVKEERIIVRLYANPDIFLQDSLKTRTETTTRRVVCSLLNKLLEFDFFEFHQIFCKETIPDLERQRMFRFFSIFDTSVSIIACKDIDSVLTEYELNNMLCFLKDDTKSLLYYDLYNDNEILASLKYTSVEIEIPISLLGKRRRDGKKTFYYQFSKENPQWLVWYQLIFNDQKFKYQIPAGAVVVKSGLVSYEMFLDCFKKVTRNVEKLKKKRGFVKNLPSLKQKYSRGGKEEDEEDSIFEIGFDEILLMNLFQFIDFENVVCLNTHPSTYYFPKQALVENVNQKLFSTRARLNNYITRFKFSENMDKIFFTPTLVDENSKYNSLLVNVFD